MGKHLLEGGTHSQQQAVVLEYLDLLGVFFQKTISVQRMQELEQQMPALLVWLEDVLPAWELDMNRHMMLHLAETVR